MAVESSDSDRIDDNADPVGGEGAPARIDQVSVETGIPKETLRAWERRYAFPKPTRNALGDREYSQLDIDRLKALKRLVDYGYRPSAIAGKSLQELREQLTDLTQQAGGPQHHDRIQPLLELAKHHDEIALKQALRVRLRDLGLEHFIMDTIAPLVSAIGTLWAVGEIEIFEEHLVSELIRSTLHEAIDAIHDAKDPPAIALATLPHEQHQLGTWMAQALFALEGARCINLGVQIAPRELLQATMAYNIDVVALSIAPSYSMRLARQYIADLDASLPTAIELWLGGSATRDLRDLPPRVRVLPALIDIRPTLQSWRAARPWNRSLLRTP